MMHKCGNVVNILSHPNAIFSSDISNEHGIMLCLSIFHYTSHFFCVSQNLLVSVNNFKALRGSKEMRAKEKKLKMSKIAQRGKR